MKKLRGFVKILLCIGLLLFLSQCDNVDNNDSLIGLLTGDSPGDISEPTDPGGDDPPIIDDPPVIEGDIITQFSNNLDVVLVSDPMVMRDGDTYYLYATGQETTSTGFKVWQSSDLVNWRCQGMCFQVTGTTWSQHDLWAPECVKGNDGIYYLYYTARPAGFGSLRRICVASSSSPLGPFSEVVTPLFTDSPRCELDGHFFEDTDGKMYMFYAKEVWLDGEFVEDQSWVVSMNSYTSVNDDFTFCSKAEQDWEKISFFGLIRWNEGAWVIKKGSTYYLMYSANCFLTSDYSVGYSTASSPYGPWTKYSGNPILSKTDDVSGPGHHSVVTDPSGQMWIVYHSHVGNGGEDRQLNIDKLNWDGDNLVVDGPTTTLQDYPNGAYVTSGSSDSFDDSTLDLKWIVASENPSKWSLTSDPGNLVITAEDVDTNEGRHDYKNIFLQHAPTGDFFIETSVNMNTTNTSEQADVFIWQDDDNYIRMGMGYFGFWIWADQKFEAAIEVNGSFSSTIVDNNMGDSVIIGIEKEGNTYRCYYKDGDDWVQVGSDMTASFGALKMGIGALSPGCGDGKNAYFDYFTIIE